MPKGRTYSPKRDGKRLATQMERFLAFMLDKDGRSTGWWLLREICDAIGCPQDGAVSARYREARNSLGYRGLRKFAYAGAHAYRLLGEGETIEETQAWWKKFPDAVRRAKSRSSRSKTYRSALAEANKLLAIHGVPPICVFPPKRKKSKDCPGQTKLFEEQPEAKPPVEGAEK